jgi:hypothetical protein
MSVNGHFPTMASASVVLLLNRTLLTTSRIGKKGKRAIQQGDTDRLELARMHGPTRDLSTWLGDLDETMIADKRVETLPRQSEVWLSGRGDQSGI